MPSRCWMRSGLIQMMMMTRGLAPTLMTWPMAMSATRVPLGLIVHPTQVQGQQCWLQVAAVVGTIATGAEVEQACALRRRRQSGEDGARCGAGSLVATTQALWWCAALW